MDWVEAMKQMWKNIVHAEMQFSAAIFFCLIPTSSKHQHYEKGDVNLYVSWLKKAAVQQWTLDVSEVRLSLNASKGRDKKKTPVPINNAFPCDNITWLVHFSLYCIRVWTHLFRKSPCSCYGADQGQTGRSYTLFLVRNVLIRVMLENVLMQDRNRTIKKKISSFLALFLYVIVQGGSLCATEVVWRSWCEGIVAV